MSIEQAQTQCPQHATASIVGGTAADGQNDSPCACIKGGSDQLSGAECAAATGIALRQAEQLQATGLGHLDDRRAALGQPAPARLNRFYQRALYLLTAQFTAAGGDDRFHRTFATIGHRALEQLRLRPDLSQAQGDSIGHPFGAEAVLERVGGDDDFHGDSPGPDRCMLTARQRAGFCRMHKSAAPGLVSLPNQAPAGSNCNPRYRLSMPSRRKGSTSLNSAMRSRR
ncbi:hypothetical protein D3C84_708040 [compost metagenome]